MGTVVLYNIKSVVSLYYIISLIVIFVLVFALKIVNKSDLRRNQQLIIKVIAAILIVCVITFILFINAIVAGIIGLVPN
mgnify:CR=1 FL=1